MFRHSSFNILSALAFAVFFSTPILVFFVDFKAIYIPLFLFHFIWFGLASSMYYHRIVTHRGAKLNFFLEIFFLIGGVVSLSGSPINWASVHRFHHSTPDKGDDPHSPVLDGHFWAYVGWASHQDENKINELKMRNSKDLLDNKLYSFFDKMPVIVLPSLFYVGGLFYLFDAGAVVYGYLLAGLLSYNFHWMLIASFCHGTNWGYRRFNTNDFSRNVPWLSFVSFGESLHNNHHQNQRSVKLRSSAWEFDFSYMALKFFQKIGLAKNLIEVNFSEKEVPFE